MHAKAKIVQIELAEVFARHAVRIEVVLLELASVLASLLVFSPEKTGGEQDERGDDRRDYINRNVAAESFDHMRSEARASSGLLKALSAQRQWGTLLAMWRQHPHLANRSTGLEKASLRCELALTVFRWLGYTLRKVKRLLAVSHNRNRKRR